jgi:acetate kinase
LVDKEAVLTINAGSSSIKFALFEKQASSPELVSRGQVESIGTAPRLSARDTKGRVLVDRSWPDGKGQSHEELLGTVLEWVDTHLGEERLVGVGHRIVHGGPDHAQPALVTPVLLDALDRLTPLAPLHQPHNLSPIRAVAGLRPRLPQVACFDTAFHRTMGEVATRFALPREYEAEGVRRYGFHGLSYEYIARRLREVAPDLARGRVIVAHLGNGASLCAMRDGRSVDTTMSLTALDGLVMGTRCGTLDPGVILYLQQRHGMAAHDIETLLYQKSGLLGVSGISSDMRTLLASNERPAREAVDLFVYRIAQLTGALASSLGGMDGFVFTAGIGEHAAEVRAMVCARLAWLGAAMDPAANTTGGASIAAPESRIGLWVIPTDEESMIARHTLDVIG